MTAHEAVNVAYKQTNLNGVFFQTFVSTTTRHFGTSTSAISNTRQNIIPVIGAVQQRK